AEGPEPAVLRGRAALTERRAGRLEERAEPDSRRARGLARPAAQAEVEMAAEDRAQTYPTLGGRSHEVDAPARRVHFLAKHAIGRALRQADPAVHTFSNLVEIEARGGTHGCHQRPPTEPPGFRTHPGSDSARRARISAKDPGSTGPQGSTAFRSSAEPRAITTLPPIAAVRWRTRVVIATASATPAPPRRTRNVPTAAEPLSRTSERGAAACAALSITPAVSASRSTSETM